MSGRIQIVRPLEPAPDETTTTPVVTHLRLGEVTLTAVTHFPVGLVRVDDVGSDEEPLLTLTEIARRTHMARKAINAACRRTRHPMPWMGTERHRLFVWPEVREWLREEASR